MKELATETIRDALEKASRRGYTFLRLKVEDEEFSAVLPVRDWEEGEEDDTVIEEIPREVKPAALTSAYVGILRWADGVTEGMRVTAGDRLGDVTALGITNEILANASGEIVAVHASSGEAVDFGRVLLEVVP